MLLAVARIDEFIYRTDEEERKEGKKKKKKNHPIHYCIIAIWQRMRDK